MSFTFSFQCSLDSQRYQRSVFQALFSRFLGIVRDIENVCSTDEAVRNAFETQAEVELGDDVCTRLLVQKVRSVRTPNMKSTG